MEIVHLKPARKGLKVAVPGRVNAYLPEDGQEVPLSNYWRRRLITGCVVRVETSKGRAPAEAISDNEIDAVPELATKKSAKRKES